MDFVIASPTKEHDTVFTVKLGRLIAAIALLVFSQVVIIDKLKELMVRGAQFFSY